MSNGSQNQCQNKTKIGSADINVGLTRCTSTARTAVTLPGINEYQTHLRQIVSLTRKQVIQTTRILVETLYWK